MLTLATPPAAAGAAQARQFDHSHPLWDKVLKEHVKDGRVDYAAIQKHPSALKAYLSALEAVDRATYESWSEERKIAFWLNAYNAYTVKLIVDHYPVNSIKDLGGWFSSVFNKEFIPLKRLRDGRTISLNDIEHETLRKDFSEPRIHFALVCASKGCPPLRGEPYVGERLDQQLDEQAKVFLNDRERNRYDAKTKTLYLSKIFDWFSEDFEKKAGSVAKYVSRFLKTSEDARIRFLDYDWSLNGTE
ncbi:MAG: DUF547 domain-containing protein [Planctomycetes bacterium]|nr:DUF547 domain-containing protein [Planctomycetota bacterium]